MPVTTELRAPGQQAPGQQALNDVAIRLSVLFLASAAIGVPLVFGSARWRECLLLAAGLALAGALMARALARSQDAVQLLVAQVVAAGMLLAVVGAAASLDDVRAFQIVAWIIAGVGGGVAMARGPAWSLATYLTAAAVTLATATWQGVAVPSVSLVGPLTFCVGGAAIYVATRRAFAASARAATAAGAAEAAHQVAVERWRARRAADRQLHDTVLSTLTLLSHGAEGVRADQLRAWCERDLAVLSGRLEPTGGPDAQEHFEPSVSGALHWLESIVAQHDGVDRGTGPLQVLVHADRPSVDAVALTSAGAQALRGALLECLENSRRHSAVSTVEIAASVSHHDLVVVVLDHGRGFEPAAVPADRMGLRVSVRERLEEVGGRVTIWSRPGEGASIVMRLPIPAAEPLAR